MTPVESLMLQNVVAPHPSAGGKVHRVVDLGSACVIMSDMKRTRSAPASGRSRPCEPQPESRLEPSDAELLEGARRGDNDCWTQIVKRYSRPLYVVAYRMLRDKAAAEDAVQDCFVRLFLNINKVESVAGFLFWCLKNRCLDLLRKDSVREETARSDKPRRKRIQWLPETDESADGTPSYMPIVEATQESDLEASRLRERLYAAILKLSPEHAAVIALHYFSPTELSFKEIAKILGLHTEVTARTEKFRALAQLRQILTREAGDQEKKTAKIESRSRKKRMTKS